MDLKNTSERSQAQKTAYLLCDSIYIKYAEAPGAVAYTCNPALWKAKAGGSPEVRSSRPA